MLPELEAIKRILRFDWDPLDMSEVCPDEYDSYAMHLFTILHQNASEQDIETYLASIEVEHMGLSRASSRTGAISAKIMQAHRTKGRTH